MTSATAIFLIAWLVLDVGLIITVALPGRETVWKAGLFLLASGFVGVFAWIAANGG